MIQSRHFQKFNFQNQFEINSDELEARYLKLQQHFHPDTNKDQAEAEINSILINQAYKILKNLKTKIILLNRKCKTCQKYFKEKRLFIT